MPLPLPPLSPLYLSSNRSSSLEDLNRLENHLTHKVQTLPWDASLVQYAQQEYKQRNLCTLTLRGEKAVNTAKEQFGRDAEGTSSYRPHRRDYTYIPDVHSATRSAQTRQVISGYNASSNFVLMSSPYARNSIPHHPKHDFEDEFSRNPANVTML